jgi:AcrR family transcriptional regulator
MKKKINLKIRARTNKDVFQSIITFFQTNDPEDITITEISKKSGYSIGNLYHHFKNTDGIFKEFIKDNFRQNVNLQIKMLGEIKPDLEATRIIQFMINSNFDNVLKKKRKAIFYIFKRFFVEQTFANELTNINLESADAILNMINANETKTFKKLNREEIELNIIMISAMFIRPILIDHKLAFTQYHKKQILDSAIALYVKT